MKIEEDNNDTQSVIEGHEKKIRELESLLSQVFKRAEQDRIQDKKQTDLIIENQKLEHDSQLLEQQRIIDQQKVEIDRLLQIKNNNNESQTDQTFKTGPIVDSQGCYIQCFDTGFVFDVKGGTLKPGSPICLWHLKYKDDAFNQRWVLTQDGFIHLESLPDLVLDVERAGHRGSKVIINKKKVDQNANQKWFIDGNNIISQANGLALDVERDSQKEGAQLIVWDRKHHTNKNQKFRFIRE
eukprot:TRINITY_DN2683_c0_g1_i1.p1 TRINITY_DN2683_c0_g1~~TRINITY_DN2683_c0_g1_i1.p1  ORF type:complete len:240 (+),score=53.57 TRINITY_DN2683_c0_g1_i1:48-767(+)